MTVPCSVPHLSGCACELTRGHRGEHRAGDLSWPRARGRGSRPKLAEETVLAHLEDGLSQAAVARLLGVSRQYVSAVARMSR